MLDNETTENNLTPVVSPTAQQRAVEIPNAAPVRLQTLDLARHIAETPNGRRYVVATFDDQHMGRGYITAAFPQQNGYLTLVRLPACELSTETPEQAVQQHRALVQAIHQGKMKDFLKAQQQKHQ